MRGKVRERVEGAAPRATSAARVLVADDHAAMANQLRALLEPEFDVVAIVRDGDTLLDAAAELAPDVIVCDIAMPGLDGIAATAEIRRRDPRARIVFVTVHDEPALIQQGLDAGALGYVLKLSAGEDLVPAVRAALRGERFVSTAARRAETGLHDSPARHLRNGQGT